MHDQQKNEDPNSIKFNFDDFDIDSFELKPVNRGLGFHKSEERVRPKKIATLEKPSTMAPMGTAPLPKSYLNTKEMMKPADIQNSIFLNEEVKTSPKIEKVEMLQRAGGVDRAAAFAIDLFIMALMVAGLGIVLMIVLERPMSLVHLEELTKQPAVWIGGLGIFSVLYLIYFSIMDMQSSLGKEIMGLTLRDVSKKNLAFTHTALRTFLSLLSFIALGLPLVLDFHSRLTDSCVFKLKK